MRRRPQTRRNPVDARSRAGACCPAGPGPGSPARRRARPRRGPAPRTSSRREPQALRVDPRDVLGVAEQRRGPRDAVRPALVEADAVRDRDAASASGAIRRSRSPALMPASARPAGPGPRGRSASRPRAATGPALPDEPDLARAPGVEHHQPDQQPPALVGRAAPRVVELVEHVGLDAAGAPLAVPRLGGAVALDGDVVRVDLRRPAVEQDPALATDGAVRAASSRSVRASTIAPRNWLRVWSPRSATSSEAASTPRSGPGPGHRAPARRGRRASGTSSAR